MGNGFQYFDLLIYAAIAVFLVIRLGRVLGKRTGFRDDADRPSSPSPRNFAAGHQAEEAEVISLPRARGAAARSPEAAPAFDASDPLSAGLARIAAADRFFSPAAFLEGAEKAFEMILQAYAKGDVDGLRPLLAPDLHDRFSAAIQERAAAGHRMESAIVTLKSREIIAADLDGDRASVTVRLASDQINTVYDTEGQVVEGDPHMLQEVVDLWTFSRMVSDRDPNWQLQATASPDDAIEADDPAEGAPGKEPA